MKVKKLTKSDTDEASHLLKDLFKESPYNEDWSLDDAKLRIREVLDQKRSVCWKVEEKEELAGFLTSYNIVNHDGIYNYIDYVGIDRNHQNKGYGQKLMKHHQEYLKENGVVSMFYYGKLKSKAWKFHTEKVGMKESKWKLLIKRLE